MVEAFEIDSQAKLVDFKGDVIQIDTKKVLVFVVHDTETVYLWRGKKADLFEKLMGTRVAAKLSHTYSNYRIRPISEGNEPAAFLQLIGTKIKK